MEHDPDEILASQIAVAREAVLAAGATAAEVAAVGIANQRETTVVWDRRSGKPIHPAIVWQDRRTSGMVAELDAAGHGELFQSRTGLVLGRLFLRHQAGLDSGAGARWPGARPPPANWRSGPSIAGSRFASAAGRCT